MEHQNSEVESSHPKDRLKRRLWYPNLGIDTIEERFALAVLPLKRKCHQIQVDQTKTIVNS